VGKESAMMYTAAKHSNLAGNSAGYPSHLVTLPKREDL